jgi:tetratricopeptide (TPR) repeat protein
VAATLLAGCAGLLVPEEAPLPPVSQNTAVVALVDGARADVASGRTEPAAAALERALRIEPRNPSLWHELAKLRLAQGRYEQAEALAQRSNTWAGDNRRLRAANFRVIGEARARRGDIAGAQAAYHRAAELEK